MDITTLSITELKALAYEQIKLLTQTQANVATIEQELAKRAQAEQPTEGE